MEVDLSKMTTAVNFVEWAIRTGKDPRSTAEFIVDWMAFWDGVQEIFEQWDKSLFVCTRRLDN